MRLCVLFPVPLRPRNRYARPFLTVADACSSRVAFPPVFQVYSSIAELFTAIAAAEFPQSGAMVSRASSPSQRSMDIGSSGESECPKHFSSAADISSYIQRYGASSLQRLISLPVGGRGARTMRSLNMHSSLPSSAKGR